MTSTGLQLLLALLAACARCGVTQGDPLPAALVELVRNSPISSIEDLQLLLLTDSVEEEDGTSLPSGGHRLPRSLDAQPAQQALCKVRTEVVEVTRAMLDRSNANFMLWPPCVEVQRCSGCCNTKSLQCVPVVTHTRYLQVMKIEYINKKPTYAKAVVSVVDHVECRCQPAPWPPTPRKKSSRRQHNHNKDQQRNQTLSQAHGQVMVHSKDEVHHWDELKQNQRTNLEDLLEQHWSPRGDTFTPPGEGYSLVGEDTSQFGEAILFGPHWAHNTTGVTETKDQTEIQEDVGMNHRRSSDGNKTISSLDVVKENNKGVEGGDWALLNMTEGKVEMENQEIPGFKEGNVGRVEGTSNSHHTNDVPLSTAENIKATFSLTTERSRFQPTKEPNPEPQEQETHKNTENPKEEQITQTEEERHELVLLYKKLDHEKEILRQQEMKQEEEKMQKEKEKENNQHHPHNKHHHHLQTTTHKSETTSQTTTQKAPATAVPRPPVHPNPAKKRKRKNRKRISKAAMRAMLM